MFRACSLAVRSTAYAIRCITGLTRYSFENKLYNINIFKLEYDVMQIELVLTELQLLKLRNSKHYITFNLM